jgi:hypothetical protein
VKHWRFYSLTDGRFMGAFGTNDKNYEEMLEANTPAGAAAKEGHFDPLTQRVDLETGEVVEYQPDVANIELVQKDAAARAEIDRLEVSQMRAVREALLELLPDGSEAKTKLLEIDGAIAEQRADLTDTTPASDKG